MEKGEISKEPVLLVDKDKGTYLYGTMIIEDKDSLVSGTDIRSNGNKGVIENNLLQENIVIPFQTDEEKQKILELVPDDFYASVDGKNIIIEFKKIEITAPAYSNSWHDGGYFRRNTDFYKCEEEGTLTIQATLKSPELSKKILDFKALVYQIKSKLYPDLFFDKYDASKDTGSYLIWLVQSGKAEILQGYNQIYSYNTVSGKKYANTSSMTPEECLNALLSGRDRYSFQCKYQDEIYNVSIGDADSHSYKEDFGGLEEHFKEYVSKLKENNDYYIPESQIPKYKLPKVGTIIIETEKNRFIIADRNQIYAELSGTPIFEKGCILSTDEKSIIYGKAEQEKILDLVYTKKRDNRKSYQEFEFESLIGYNNDQVLFLFDREIRWNRKPLLPEKIQRFEREDRDKPCTIFSTGDTIGFIDGKKVRLSDDKGNITTFEFQDGIENIQVKNGFALINGHLVCCGIHEGTWLDECIKPFFRKVENIDKLEQYMAENEMIRQEYFIENDNGCFFIGGLTEQEKLKLYREKGFTEQLNKLETIIREREEEKKENDRKVEEARQKVNEYLEGKVLSIGHLGKRVSINRKATRSW